MSYQMGAISFYGRRIRQDQSYMSGDELRNKIQGKMLDGRLKEGKGLHLTYSNNLKNY